MRVQCQGRASVPGHTRVRFRFTLHDLLAIWNRNCSTGSSRTWEVGFSKGGESPCWARRRRCPRQRLVAPARRGSGCGQGLRLDLSLWCHCQCAVVRPTATRHRRVRKKHTQNKNAQWYVSTMVSTWITCSMSHVVICGVRCTRPPRGRLGLGLHSYLGK